MAIAIRKISVPRHHQRIAQGQTVTIFAEIIDAALTSTLLVPTVIPLIRIYDSLNIQHIQDAEMSNFSTGLYYYNFPTTNTHPTGPYTVTITAIYVDQAARIERVVAFVIITTSELAQFNYFGIKDQQGNIWYWYIHTDNTLNSIPTIPAFATKQAVDLSSAAIPYWLVLTNAAAQNRFIYPSLSGEPTVTDTQPLIGTGVIGSQTLKSAGSGSYTIVLTLSEDVTIAIV